MDNISGVFEVLKKVNEKNNFNLISNQILEEELDNINDLVEINDKLTHVLHCLSQEQERENLRNKLVELHLVIADIEWQYDQLHDIIRQVIGNLADGLDD
ncbi:hypothetical protein [Listeria booriae]|uniref:hypothetical protein n=1 Tax=Listeria booriae TaxID=1552123 RepID=UPI0016236BAC|nr:hypothetical protein [Listeria booriae]MBC2322566.1 hypothetical protein [Listeria booriae]MCD2206428.1 hypothetical protein [Listeria booriae]